MHYSHGLSHSRIAQVVGAFIVIPLIVLIVAGVFMAKAEHLFERRYHLYTNLIKSHGLEPGAPVLVSGIPIGRVESVDITDTATIQVILRMRMRYQELVRGGAQVKVTKSGVVVGQTLIEIEQGDRSSPALPDGATLIAVEPKDIADLINEVQPVIDKVKQTLIHVEAITQDLQGTVKAGGRALEDVARATQELPALVSSIQRTVTSVEQTAASLPDMTGSIKKTLKMVNGIAGDVKNATAKVPVIIDTAQETAKAVQTVTESMKEVSRELVPLVQTANSTVDDVSTIIRGAKNTFPISRFVKNADTSVPVPSEQGIVSLRGDELSR